MKTHEWIGRRISTKNADERPDTETGTIVDTELVHQYEGGQLVLFVIAFDDGETETMAAWEFVLL